MSITWLSNSLIYLILLPPCDCLTHGLFTSVHPFSLISIMEILGTRAMKTAINTVKARGKLPPRKAPYWEALDTGVHLGYAKGKTASTWIARKYDGDGTYTMQKIGSTDDNGAGLSYVEARRAALDTAPAAKKDRLTVRDIVEAYLKASTAKSLDDTRVRANALIISRLGDIEAAKLTTRDIADWLDWLVDRHTDRPLQARQATANRTLTILKAALNHGFQKGRIPSDTAWRRVKPFPGTDRPRERHLSPGECRALIDAAEPGFRPLVEAALLTGCRYGELAALQVDQIDLQAGLLTIPDSKSGKPRSVVLTDEGMAFFAGLVEGRQGFVFTKPSGEPWKRADQHRPMTRAAGAAGLEGVTFHILRHTWATLAVKAGMPLQLVARNLGHANTRMVEAHYGHIEPGYAADTIRKHAPKFTLETAR